MLEKTFTPDIEKVKQISLQFKEIFTQIDQEILALDILIAELDQQIQSSPLYKYRKNNDQSNSSQM